jgi:hypothetical protein
MLIEFQVKNFRSFRDQQVLSMVAASDKELRDTNTAKTPAFKHNLVRSAIIYGPNASGKSNLILALGFAHLFMLTAVNSPPTSGQRAIEHPLLRPFLLSTQERQAPTEFELIFIHQDVRYQYGLILDREQIHEEWLIAYPKGQPQTWFERRLRTGDAAESQAMRQPTLFDSLPGGPGLDNDRHTWYFGSKLGGEKQRLADITRPDVPFLAAAATFGNSQLRTVYDWFATRLAVLNPWGRPDLFGETARLAAENPHLRKKIGALLSQADFGIDDFSVRVVPANDDAGLARLPSELQQALSGMSLQRTEVRMRHPAPEIDEGQVEFPGEDESLGTQRFFSIAGPIILALERGQVLAVDEIDDSLHPLLVRRLVGLFHSQETNPHGAQLIMNTHDATMLDTRLFRRDQIWFTEKESTGSTRLFPLSDYSPRKDEALSKGYLHGRYGAVPALFDLGESLRQPQESAAASNGRRKSRQDNAETTH